MIDNNIMNTTIQILLNKHSTWGSLLDSPDYDKICEEDAMHNYQDYYGIEQLKEELGGNEDILIAVRKLKKELRDLKTCGITQNELVELVETDTPPKTKQQAIALITSYMEWAEDDIERLTEENKKLKNDQRDDDELLDNALQAQRRADKMIDSYLKLIDENEQLKKNYVKLQNNSYHDMIECIACGDLVEDALICPRMYEAQGEKWCMDCSVLPPTSDDEK